VESWLISAKLKEQRRYDSFSVRFHWCLFCYILRQIFTVTTKCIITQSLTEPIQFYATYRRSHFI